MNLPAPPFNIAIATFSDAPEVTGEYRCIASSIEYFDSPITEDATEELRTWCCPNSPPPPARLFIRGDCDGDGGFNGLLDGLRALNFQFVPGTSMPPCMEACDADGDGLFNGLLDGLRILNHQFIPGTAPPPAPGLECGVDPDPASSLGCDTHDPVCNP